ALVRTPSIYLMDEPLSSLDAKLREDLRIELKRIQKDLGATILYVTHDQLEAMTLADRIGVLSEGALVQLGTPREVYESPANIHVARRLGSPQINILPAGSALVPSAPSTAHSLGIRPEDVEIGQGGVDGKILAVENLGAETVVLLETDGRRLHALLPPGLSLESGGLVSCSVREGAALLFDKDENLIDWPQQEIEGKSINAL
ncbi:MAG: ABC transporter ATP-binding protein, partial [Kiloniellales bacterium]|nr:ABC transporter ATP-binding protein [Kiloniellales bacterium]